VQYAIDFINDTKPSVNYSVEAVEEYEQGLGDGVDKYTGIFEAAFNLANGDDIGGLIVYANGDTVKAVYDYENFVGWLV
jgi:hypothetical protein